MRKTVYCITCGAERNPKYRPGQCHACKIAAQYEKRAIEHVAYLEANGYEVLDKTPTLSAHLKPIYKLIRKECGHEYTAVFQNIHKQIIDLGIAPCSICGVELKKQKVADRNRLGCPEKSRIALAEYNEKQHQLAKERRKSKEFSDRKNYVDLVRMLSNAEYRKNYYEINPAGHKRSKFDHHLDHIVPIDFCFKNGIPAELCASRENLQMLVSVDNISKSASLSTEAKLLLEQWGYSLSCL